MATRLSPRNSEVNALEQRGYLIGKKIGQVVPASLSFVLDILISRIFNCFPPLHPLSQ